MGLTTISIHQVRAEQLRQIARHHDVQTSDVLDEFVRHAWRNIFEDVTPPGFDLAADRDDETGEPTVFFAANGTLPATGTLPVEMTPQQARDVARGLRALVDRSVARFEVEAVRSNWRASIIGTRKGRGFTLQIHDNLDEAGRPSVKIHGLTHSLTEDLAEAFEAHADKADDLTIKVVQ